MNLKRYNDWLIAVAGTLIAGSALVIISLELWRQHTYNRPPAGLIVDAPPGKPKPTQVLSQCGAVFVPGTDFQYIPVAAVVTDDSGNNASVSSLHQSSVSYDRAPGSLLTSCAGHYSVPYSIFNVVIRNAVTREQRLLLKTPAQVSGLFAPDAHCAEPEATVPCATLFWLIRDHDTNGDGVVNSEDAVGLYVSDLVATTLHRVSPVDATVLDWRWSARSGELQILVRHDVDHSGKFTDKDGTELIATKGPLWAEGTPVLEPTVISVLENAVR